MLEDVVIIDTDPYSDSRAHADILKLVKYFNLSKTKTRYFKQINAFGVAPIAYLLLQMDYEPRVFTLKEYDPEYGKSKLKYFTGVNRDLESTFIDFELVQKYARDYPYLNHIKNAITECYSTQMLASVRYGARVARFGNDKKNRRIVHDCQPKVRSIKGRWRKAYFCHSDYVTPDSWPEYIRVKRRCVNGQAITSWAHDPSSNLYMFQDHPSMAGVVKHNMEFNRIIRKCLEAMCMKKAA